MRWDFRCSILSSLLFCSIRESSLRLSSISRSSRISISDWWSLASFCFCLSNSTEISFASCSLSLILKENSSRSFSTVESWSDAWFSFSSSKAAIFAVSFSVAERQLFWTISISFVFSASSWLTRSARSWIKCQFFNSYLSDRCEPSGKVLLNRG